MHTDPLEGYKPRTEQDDENEEIVRGIRGLTDAGVDVHSIADIVAAKDLIDALEEDKTLGKLVDHAVQIIKTHSLAWTMSNDPSKLKEQHLEARAANLILSWADSIAQTGKVAEQLIQQQDIEENEQER